MKLISDKVIDKMSAVISNDKSEMIDFVLVFQHILDLPDDKEKKMKTNKEKVVLDWLRTMLRWGYRLEFSVNKDKRLGVILPIPNENMSYYYTGDDLVGLIQKCYKSCVYLQQSLEIPKEIDKWYEEYTREYASTLDKERKDES